ncbi:four helix bundle protein [Chryseobacterium hagamense]|uniref:four helix bundle protein n=1 Tax=Chryseobacterium hagamense TaxID=395935 RepID=UPI0027D98559|nr:four helix bundle protein [Chryseobacterium hagamense]
MTNSCCVPGTSIGANAFEAQNPHSKNDFISKIKIAAKELEETKYWLYLLNIPERIHLMKNWNVKLQK